MTSRRSCWECSWLMRCQQLSDRSTCLTRSVGAVAVRNKHAVSEGYNGTPSGFRHCEDGGCYRCKTSEGPGQTLGQCWCVHAEANLVAYAASAGHPLAGTTIYSTTQPCVECTKLLLAAGVLEVVYADAYPGALEIQAASGVVFRPFHCTCR